MSVFIIAEAGANHNKNLDQAYTLVDIAYSAGADAIKFQTYSSGTLYSRNTPDFAGHKNISQLIKDIELPRQWQKDIKQYCDEVGIEFMSTPFDESAVEELVNLNVRRLKISGFESTDPRFVRMIASTGLPLIISAGISCGFEQIDKILEDINSVNGSSDITILHCNSAYPTPPEDISLNQLDILISEYPELKFGLSDHTMNPFTPALAVAKGAKCIEKHFTISRKLPGPDHPFALEPHMLKEMVQGIRYAELCCTSRLGDISNSEKRYAKGRRSVVARTNIKKGELFTKENLTTKRPLLKNSIPAVEYYEIIGKRSLCDIEEDTILTRKVYE